MKKYLKIIIICSLLLQVNFCICQQRVRLIDANATTETKALCYNLHQLSKQHILFGHQHAMEYGHGWSGEEGKSDVKSVTGSHPAVIGVDFSGLSGKPDAEVENTKEHLKKYIEATYNNGGVITASWHFNNPVSATDFYWKDSGVVPAVKYIIPGGSYNEKYKNILKNIAAVAKSVKGKDGKSVPIIFRPFHEFDGDWFWWGSSHCTVQEFTTLWKFTVSYLRDSLSVHNFIYAFSPDNKFHTIEKYLERYPGNEWVDMLGIDNYGDWGRDGKYDTAAGIKKLIIVSDYAIKANKLAAFTETGLESIPNTSWWTETLLKALKSSKVQLAYVLVWRNDAKSTTHYYAPFPGHSSVPDFLNFYNDPYTLFEKDLPNMYTLKTINSNKTK